MNGGMANGTVGIEGFEPLVPGGGAHMATEAEISGTLMKQHMAVWGAMYLMAARTPFDHTCGMFIQVRPAFVNMTLQAGLVFEAGQTFSD